MPHHPPHTSHPPGRPRSRAAAISVRAVRGPLFLALAVLAGGALGCKSTLDMSAFRGNDEAEIERLASTKGVHGPLERSLLNQQQTNGDMHRLEPMAGEAELEAAKKLFEQGEHRQAEKELGRLAKKYDDTPVEEDAIFLIAESKFHRGELPKAQDQYNKLLKEYPSTRHLETSTRRLFDIGREWLDFPKEVETSEVQQVNFERPSHTPPPSDPEQQGWDLPLVPNLTDEKRPTFDTKGRGLEALRAIWLNDPTGPLADDALMLTASHHLREGNYQQAAYLFKILREEYPRSPHLEKAFVLGSHVELMAYQGARYDGDALAEAKSLKESTLRLFPNTSTRDRIRDELEKIDKATAEREWEMVEYWQGKGKPRAVAMQCREVIRLFPDSEYAARARALLRELPPDAVQLATPVRKPPEPNLLQRIPRVQLPQLLPVPSEKDDTDDMIDDPFPEGGSVEDAVQPQPQSQPRPQTLPQPRLQPQPTPPPQREYDRPVDVIQTGGTARAPSGARGTERPVDAVLPSGRSSGPAPARAEPPGRAGLWN
jgi:outer membrane protein assembly factor BamD (BamD/ComL family)